MKNNWIFLLVLFCGAATTVGQTSNTGNQQSAKRYDLNGLWEGKFTVLRANGSSLLVERVMIQQIGDDFVATKITGDEVVPAGKVTIRGKYTSNPFHAEQACVMSGISQWAATTVTIVDAIHLKVAGNCGGLDVDWVRIGKPTLALDSAILFDTNQYTLRADSEAALTKIMAFLQEMHPKSHLQVAGYTDNVGQDAYNLRLSRKRADAVVAWLRQHGIAVARLRAVGYGKASPRYPNTNDDARSHNRRVEITVLD